MKLTGNVRLGGTLLGEPLGEDIVHRDRGEGDGEGPLGVVTRHGGDVEALGDLNLDRLVVKGEERDQLAHTV